MKNILDNFDQGLKMMDTRMYDEAERIFNDIIPEIESMTSLTERNIWLSKAYNNIGFILYKKVEFHKAQEFYRKSMIINPSFAPPYYNHGVICYRLGLFEASLKHMKKAVQLEHRNSEFVTGLQASETALNGNIN